jgi:predicted AlkP superfamily phosphohydrolase/phosphomutase
MSWSYFLTYCFRASPRGYSRRARRPDESNGEYQLELPLSAFVIVRSSAEVTAVGKIIHQNYRWHALFAMAVLLLLEIHVAENYAIDEKRKGDDVSINERRILCIGLDAFEVSLAESMIAEGRLPHMRRLAATSARFRLDHHRAKFTGLAWEHFSTGRSPDKQRRWSAVSFDPRTYSVEQTSTRAKPFVAGLGNSTVVFDIPYFNLEKAPNVIGVTSWGSHDPGTQEFSRPASLRDELAARYGDYPAGEWVYGFSWPSVGKSKNAGEALCKAVRIRTEAAHWLLGERVPHWQLGIVVVSESHSAIEQFWHGIDASHPLHSLPSVPHARRAIVAVYEAIDDLIGRLTQAFPDAIVLLFSMHGMGSNKADLPAMFLVPELMYRHAFRRAYARQRAWPACLTGGTPVVRDKEVWDTVMRKVVPWPRVAGTKLARLRRLLGDRRQMPDRSQAGNLGWMPAARYARFWPSMPAFALPAYYDVQLRLNLVGREASGIIPPDRYDHIRRQIVDVILDCRDPISGREVVEEVIFRDKPPAEIGPTEADIYLSFVSDTTGLRHPTLGIIGPAPYRRTGGHTGDWGFLYVGGLGADPGDRGTADAFDVAPTIIDLLGAPLPADLSGTSLMPRVLSKNPIMV